MRKRNIQKIRYRTWSSLYWGGSSTKSTNGLSLNTRLKTVLSAFQAATSALIPKNILNATFAITSEVSLSAVKSSEIKEWSKEGVMNENWAEDDDIADYKKAEEDENSIRQGDSKFLILILNCIEMNSTCSYLLPEIRATLYTTLGEKLIDNPTSDSLTHLFKLLIHLLYIIIVLPSSSVAD